MPTEPLSRIQEDVLANSHNSSHFVWLLGKFEFHHTQAGWLFAYLRQGSTIVVALDPIPPSGKNFESLEAAFSEFSAAQPAARYIWAGVRDITLQNLPELPWQALLVGREPWITLKDHGATGKSARGVKSGRNQALRAGLRVEEWRDVGESPEKLAVLQKLYAGWKRSTFLQLEGFLQATNHAAFVKHRRYFVVRSAKKTFGFLVASPVKARKGFYFEDLILDPQHPRGASELLVSDAIEKIRESDALEVSLGLVPLTFLSPHLERPPGPVIRIFFRGLKQWLRLFYNSEGILIYRKRFRPTYWENSYLLLLRADRKTPGVKDWGLGTFALLSAHRPRLQFHWAAFRETFIRPVMRHPVSLFFLLANGVTFGFINRGNALPNWALEEYGFHASASIAEWVKRTICSDFLFWDQPHFYVISTLLILVLFQLEKIYPRRLLALIVLGTVVFDDMIDFLLIKKPLDYFHPKIFSKIIEYHDVGPSLICLTLVGMWVYSLKRWREPIFVLLSLGMVFGFSFTSVHLHHFFLNINHVFFLGVGYIAAHARQEWERKRSQKMARKAGPNRRADRPRIQ